MAIYTKVGDHGETFLIGGGKLPKDELRVAAYGSIDELNAVLGVVLAQSESAEKFPSEVGAELTRIQNELFVLGAEMATPKGTTTPGDLLQEDAITRLEKAIDQLEASLPKLKNFILPGGTKVAATLHLARTVCRRVERKLVALHRHEPLRVEVLKYLNRLGDYFFVCARQVNVLAGKKEVIWKGSP